MIDNAVKDGLSPGAVRPNCSRTTGIMPLSRACKLNPSLCPYALHLVNISRKSSFATTKSGLAVWMFTSSQSSEPCGSMMLMSALWMGRTLPGAGCPSSCSWSGMSMACSVVAVRPACRASLVKNCRKLSWRVVNCRDVLFPSPSRRPFLTFADENTPSRFQRFFVLEVAFSLTNQSSFPADTLPPPPILGDTLCRKTKPQFCKNRVF